MIKFVTFSGVILDRHYKLIRFGNGMKYSDLLIGSTKRENITEEKVLGKLIQIRQYGRPYDPDVCFEFEKEDGEVYPFDPSFTGRFGYVEYDPEEDSEIKSMERTIERTLLLKIEIEGNDWALRPENVVATQGIDLSSYAEGR